MHGLLDGKLVYHYNLRLLDVGPTRGHWDCSQCFACPTILTGRHTTDKGGYT